MFDCLEDCYGLVPRRWPINTRGRVILVDNRYSLAAIIIGIFYADESVVLELTRNCYDGQYFF